MDKETDNFVGKTEELLLKATSLGNAGSKILTSKCDFKKRQFFSPFSQQDDTKYALEYNRYFSNNSMAYSNIVKMLSKKVGFLRHPGTLLDVGCGSGLFLSEVCKSLPQALTIAVYGLDSSQTMIDIAQNRHKAHNNIIFIKGKVEDMISICHRKHIQPNYITCISVLHQIRKPEEAIQNMLEIIADGGTIFIQDILRDSPWHMKRKRLLHLLQENPQQFIARLKGHLSALTKKDFLNILKRLDARYAVFEMKRANYYDPTIGVLITKKGKKC